MVVVTGGVTPKVAGVHFDDFLNQFIVHISFQLQTPFGYFQKEEHLTFADLASALTAIKAIWAIVADDVATEEKYVFAPLGDFSTLTAVPDGTSLRTYVYQPPPPVDVAAILEPDTEPDYDGESDSWGETLGP